MDLRLVKYFDVLILWLLSVSSLATFFTPFISLTHALSLTLSHALSHTHSLTRTLSHTHFLSLSHTHSCSFPPFFVATSTHIFFHKKPRLPNISWTRQLADYIVCLLSMLLLVLAAELAPLYERSKVAFAVISLFVVVVGVVGVVVPVIVVDDFVVVFGVGI